jgi:hypothetical protein
LKKVTFLCLWVFQIFKEEKTNRLALELNLMIEQILGIIRLNLTFHSENAKCDPMNFNALKIFSISCLNLEVSLDVVALLPLAKKMCKNMVKLG